MKIVDFIVCDDVRSEVGGQVTLVGVYTDGIKVAAVQGQLMWPIVLPKLGVFVRFLASGSEFVPSTFILSFLHNGNLVARFEGGIVITDISRSITIAISGNNFPIPSPGKLTCSIELKSAAKSMTLTPEISLMVETAAPPVATAG
ncbi:MAG TPA: hypothetical protein VGL61_04515 [Kofleriaceae bacterium]|jgi:hypothetical protein